MLRHLAIVLTSAALSGLAACGGTSASTDSADVAVANDAADTVGLPDANTTSCEGLVCPAGSHCVLGTTSASCACDSGKSQVGAGCLDTTFVHNQCRLSCLELAACGKNTGLSDEACVTACVNGALDGEAFAKATCIAMNYEHDTLWCGVIDACNTLAKGDDCAAQCAAKDKCGFLAAPGITSGASQAECQVLCRAYDTVYGNLKTSDSYKACVDKATASCDRFELAVCEAYNGADICSNVCGWLGSAKYCNYIPGRWSDEAACKQECAGWTPKQTNAVFGCYNKLNFAGCNTEKAVACFKPPTELPAGVTALTDAVASVCPDAMATQDPNINAWHFLGRTALWPDWMHDFGSAVACVKAVTTCPSHYDFDWIAPCFLTIAPDVTAACNTALQCLISSPAQVPYLTVDGTTGMDESRCKVSWQQWKTKDSTAFTGVASCLGKTDATDCTAVQACIAGGDPDGAACNDLVPCWEGAGVNPYGLSNVDGAMCGGLLAFGQDPKVAQCVLKAKDCAAKNACLPIQSVATNAAPACALLVPCWDAAGVNPFPALGKLSVSSCAVATSIYNSKSPGVADMIYGCLQSASDCKARLACLPAQ